MFSSTRILFTEYAKNDNFFTNLHMFTCFSYLLIIYQTLNIENEKVKKIYEVRINMVCSLNKENGMLEKIRGTSHSHNREDIQITFNKKNSNFSTFRSYASYYKSYLIWTPHIIICLNNHFRTYANLQQCDFHFI